MLRRLSLPIALLLSALSMTAADGDTWLTPWTVRHEEILGDVRAFADVGEIGAVPGTVVPSRKEGDIRRLDVNHLTGSQQRVTTELSFRDLAAFVDGEETQHFLEYRIRTPRMVRFIDWTWDAVNPGARRPVMRDASGRTVRCALIPGSTRAGSFRTWNSVPLGIPRSCLGNPEWVRIGVRSMSFTDGTAWVDDARSGSAYSTIVLGPEIPTREFAD